MSKKSCPVLCSEIPCKKMDKISWKYSIDTNLSDVNMKKATLALQMFPKRNSLNELEKPRKKIYFTNGRAIKEKITFFKTKKMFRWPLSLVRP